MNSDYSHEAPRPSTRRAFVARDGVKLERGYIYLAAEVWDALDRLTKTHAFENTSQTVAKLALAAEESAQDNNETSRP
jgi:hypothetical protein